VPFLLWSHNEARARGVAVDEKKLAEWTDWTVTFSQSRRAWFTLTGESLDQLRGDGVPPDVLSEVKALVGKPFRTEGELLAELGRALTPGELEEHKGALVKRAARPAEVANDGGGLDTLSQLLLGRARGGRGTKATEFLADTQDLMVRWQQPNGSWKAAGQLPRQNRPEAEANEATTLWAVLALATLDQRDAPAESAIKRAVDFLDNVKTRQSNESLLGALLVQRKVGQPGRAADLLEELLGRQNPDGGWAWRQGGDSDAFATGQVLYALTQSARSADHAAVRRARAYLIDSQTDDGSWSVPSRAISSAANEARLKKVAPIYRYWGTGWATIGLSGTLPETKAGQRASK
jgi:hypothetical protein